MNLLILHGPKIDINETIFIVIIKNNISNKHIHINEQDTDNVSQLKYQVYIVNKRWNPYEEDIGLNKEIKFSNKFCQTQT